MKRKFGILYAIAKDTVIRFMDNGGSLLSAAVAFYAILSVAPLALVAVAVAGLLFGQDAATGQLQDGLSRYMGEEAADNVGAVIEALRNHTARTNATVIGGILLLFTGSRLFSQVQDAINQLWHVRTEFKSFKVGVLTTLYKKFLSFVMVFALGAVLAALIVFTTVTSALRQLVGDLLPASWLFWSGASILTTAVLVALSFALTYRLMPDAQVRWRHALSGASVAALLFMGAEYPLNYYIAHQGVASVYGAAGSLVVFLLWVYYASHIFFLGAQLTRVLADRNGDGVIPDPMAILVRQVPVTTPEEAIDPGSDSDADRRDSHFAAHKGVASPSPL